MVRIDARRQAARPEWLGKSPSNRIAGAEWERGQLAPPPAAGTSGGRRKAGPWPRGAHHLRALVCSAFWLPRPPLVIQRKGRRPTPEKHAYGYPSSVTGLCRMGDSRRGNAKGDTVPRIALAKDLTWLDQPLTEPRPSPRRRTARRTASPPRRCCRRRRRCSYPSSGSRTSCSLRRERDPRSSSSIRRRCRSG
jgi:hypothetical protein